MLFTLGFIFVFGIYLGVVYYTDIVEQRYPSVNGKTDPKKTYLLLGIGFANSTLNFILQLIYDQLVNSLVDNENHMYIYLLFNFFNKIALKQCTWILLFSKKVFSGSSLLFSH